MLKEFPLHVQPVARVWQNLNEFVAGVKAT